ncbi:MAG: RNA methyltransferase [Candidatus Actinomarinales bacterium]|nr:MAG: RNA methyltransferase [Candidatus Actinomarinales bacterium]
MENKLITSLANPEIKFISSLKKNTNRKEHGKTIAEGYRENKSLIESGRAIDSLYICRDLIQDKENKKLIDLFAEREIRIVETSKKPFVHISYRDKPDGFISIFPIYEQSLLDLSSEDTNKILIADQIEKPGNLGAIIRSAKAFKFNTVIVCDEKTNVFNPNVIRSSIGHLFTMNVITSTSSKIIEFLGKNSIEILLLDPAAKESLRSYTPDGKFSLVVGSEDKGISEHWFEAKSTTLRIDSPGDIDSINASTAASIAMWELSK